MPRLLGGLVAAAMLVAACTSGTADAPVDPDARPGTSAAVPIPSVDPDRLAPGDDETPLAPAAFEVRAGTEQLAVLGAEPGEVLTVHSPTTGPVVSGEVDALGSLLFRDLPPGGTFTVRSETAESAPVSVRRRDEHPGADAYRAVTLPAPGFGYLPTRDGTTLGVHVVLPGPPEAGPYPTLVEYSGYTPSDPDASGIGDLFGALGYAYVGVNMRGTGCSGGSFRYFEPVQSLDGYDVIETVAAQPWSAGVGMVGVSYPGISQLFVAATRPPSLAAITPLSVLDDSFASTLYPGGILNTGFAVAWARERVEEARPEGQSWAAARIAAGDEECEQNQRLRLQNPDLLAEIRATTTWVSPLGEELAPWTFVDRIEVPVFLAGAWQDEQTGGRFATMLDRFTGSDRVFATLTNGLHTDSIGPYALARMIEFLDLYVAERTPDLAVARVLAPVLGAGIFGTSELDLPPDRFDGLDPARARAAFEADPPVQVLFESGAADGAVARAPLPRFVAGFDAWPVPDADVVQWYLAPGRLRDDPIIDPDDPDAGTSEYLALPDARPATYYDGSSSGIWRVDAEDAWLEPAPGTAAWFLSDPLDEDLVLVGSSSLDLWITSNLGDTDLEVTLSEVHPDGAEVLVQGGWLRASHRTLDPDRSTPTRPVQSHLAADVTPLPDDRFEPVRIEIFPVAHVFRSGSRVRVTIDAPGGDRSVWAFDTIADGERVTIAHDADHPSRLVVPVVRGLDVPAGVAPCGSLRGQPCRR